MAKPDDNDGFSFDELLELEAKANTDELDMASAVGSVKKIEQDKVLIASPSMDKETSRIKKDAASRDTKEEEIDYFSSTHVPLVGPNDVLAYRSPGAQPFLLKKLKNGDYREADFIDLHGKKLEEAYEYTRRYILYSREQGYRCILIIHGKGEMQKQKATIKSYLAHWLRQMPEVLAFHSAPDWKGGTGALLVVLKKSDKESIVNRERHAVRTR